MTLCRTQFRTHVYIVQQRRVYLDANCQAKGAWQVTDSVHVGEIHTVGELQAGDLPRVVLHFQISRHQRNMNRLALRGAGAFGANAVKFQISVMGLHEFVDDSVHSFTIVLAASNTANRSKTLEPSLVSTSKVTLLA